MIISLVYYDHELLYHHYCLCACYDLPFYQHHHIYSPAVNKIITSLPPSIQYFYDYHRLYQQHYCPYHSSCCCCCRAAVFSMLPAVATSLLRPKTALCCYYHLRYIYIYGKKKLLCIIPVKSHPYKNFSLYFLKKKGQKYLETHKTRNSVKPIHMFSFLFWDFFSKSDKEKRKANFTF